MPTSPPRAASRRRHCGARRLGALLLALLSFPALAPAARAASHARARSSAARHVSVSAALAGLERSGAISQSTHARELAVYVSAKRSLHRLAGVRRAELGAVIANLQAIAAAGRLSASRVPALFLTVERNQQWWTREPLLTSGERVSFPPSKLVWQYYAGQGLEIQWLGTFGEANGYFSSGHENANLRQVVSEALALASERAGGIAWEYMFKFDGGNPPWTSGLSQGTALQVLARAFSRFGDAADLAAAKRALGVFQAPPPEGVRVDTHAGAYYAEYTYAPGDRILNGFIQAVLGLYDYTALTHDPLGLTLFEAGDAEARAEVPHYDTGAWSLYDQFGESNLNYHELLSEFLAHLCARTQKGPPLAPATPTPTTPTTPTTPQPQPPGGGGSGGTGAPSTAARARSASAIAGDQIYCSTAQRFTADLSTPPLLSLLSHTLPTNARAGVQVSLSKIATVRLTVRRGGRVVFTNSATVAHGKPRLLWPTPGAQGAYSIAISATDLAGNFTTTSGTITLANGAKAH